MTCRDAERWIDTFFDGELEGRLMREAALHITRCRRCENEIQEREHVHDLLKSAIDDELAGVDLSTIWTGIEPVIARETRVRRVLPWRLAAASVRMRGVRWGGSERASGALDSNEASVATSGRWLAPRVTGLAVLAASVMLAVSLATREGSSPLPGEDLRADAGGERVTAHAPTVGRRDARVSAPEGRGTYSAPQMVRASASASSTGSVASPVATRSRRHGGQVRIESVDSRGGAMAMWSVPASDTAVIWIGDADPRVRPAR